MKNRLRGLVDSHKIPHALLIEGPAGTGKFAMARAMAQYIHCQNHTSDGDSCGQCPACKQHAALNHIDTIYSFPVVKKGETTVSDDFMPEFRRFIDECSFMDFEKWLLLLDNINAQPMIYVSEANELIRKLSFTAHGRSYKIVIMWLPERLKEDAANKLLKLVEEPHSDTLFIMVSDNPRGILPTIFSRTQRIQVKRYPDATVSTYLQRKYGLADYDADEVARLANGNMTTAINTISVSKNSDEYLEMFMELMRKAYTRKIADLKRWAANLAELGREREMGFWEYCARMMRENYVLNLHKPELNYLNRPESDFSSRFAPFINHKNVEQLIKTVDDARIDIAANANAKLVNFDVAIKVILLLKR